MDDVTPPHRRECAADGKQVLVDEEARHGGGGGADGSGRLERRQLPAERCVDLVAGEVVALRDTVDAVTG